MKLDNNTIMFLGDKSIPKIYLGLDVVYEKEEPTPAYDGLCFTALEDSTVLLTLVGTPATYTTYDLQTSTDGTNWTAYTIGDTISIATGNKLYWKGNNTAMAESISIYKQFVMTGKIAASGNCDSLLGTDTLADYAFRELFMDCDSLTAAPLLPATTLKEYCYSTMFYGCTSLTTAPELPATTLALYCYSSMFYGCTSLTTAPELPATTLALYCYSGMFSDCKSLTTAPELPATTLANYCYYSMFNGCSNLTTAPELPATTLANYCYYSMFNRCTSLTKAPELPATTLATCCYYYMFYGCTSLIYVKALFTTTPEIKYTGGWMQNVSSTGTFIKNPEATWDSTITRSGSTVPEGWTITTENS